jgi:hypothetical protein
MPGFDCSLALLMTHADKILKSAPHPFFKVQVVGFDDGRPRVIRVNDREFSMPDDFEEYDAATIVNSLIVGCCENAGRVDLLDGYAAV